MLGALSPELMMKVREAQQGASVAPLPESVEQLLQQATSEAPVEETPETIEEPVQEQEQ
jgi:hypothetical protein